MDKLQNIVLYNIQYMPELGVGEVFPSNPKLTLVQRQESIPDKRIAAPPKELTPLKNLRHIERHWGPGVELGSSFVRNDYFTDAKTLVDLVENVVQDLVVPEKNDRNQVFTVGFPEGTDIGQIGVTALKPDEPSIKMLRDGQAEVIVVPRLQKQSTNLITFDLKPIKRKDGSVELTIGSIFPGEPAPRLITTERELKYQADPKSDPEFVKDREYWNAHAFIVESDIPGEWYVQNTLPLPVFNETPKEGVVESGRQTRILVKDDENKVYASLNASTYYDIYPDIGDQYDTDAIEQSIWDYMKKRFPDKNLSITTASLTDEKFNSAHLDRVLVGSLESITGGKADNDFIKYDDDE